MHAPRSRTPKRQSKVDLEAVRALDDFVFGDEAAAVTSDAAVEEDSPLPSDGRGEGVGVSADGEGHSVEAVAEEQQYTAAADAEEEE